MNNDALYAFPVGLLIFALVIFLMSIFFYNAEIKELKGMNAQLKSEAVEREYAEWVNGESGYPEFRWK